MSSSPSSPIPSNPSTPRSQPSSSQTFLEKAPPVGLLTLSAAAVLRSKSYLRSLEARILQIKKDMALLEGDILEARARIAYFNREIEYWEQAAKWPADLYGRPPKSMAELQDEKQRAIDWVRRLTMDHKDLWIEIGYLQETLEKEFNA